MNYVTTLFAAALLSCATAAAAQSEPAPEAFTGAYAGSELGAHEHHFYLNVTDLGTNRTEGRYYRAWGVGGGAFAGFDFALAERVRLGLEAGVSLGGNNPVARFADGTTYTQHPRFGYRATGKVGYLLRPRLLAYGTFGYGGHKYRLGGTAKVADVHEWGSSFTIGAGFQYRVSRRVDVRLDFRHLDNAMSHILIGVPVRF
ncbi:MAG TPA: outer membrane beta-barrel protein [Allosphingosinicella sp.]|jgi:outer membrane immunogenic protein